MDVRLVVEVERMNGLINFLTTEEMIVVYALVGIASVLYLIIYILDKSYYKRKQRQNTKELRKIVDEVSEKIEPEVKEELKQEPVITQVVEQKEEKIEVTPVVEPVIVEPKKEEAIEILSTPQESVTIPEIEPVQQTVIEKVQQEEKESLVENQETLAPVVEKIEEGKEAIPEEELQYTSIEPNPTEAQAELMRLTETLEKAEEEVKNIELTAFEEEQEQNAIISLDELMERGKAMYENGEFDKLEDEGNEPISLQDLEERMKEAKENVAAIEEEPVITEVTPVSHQMVLDDFQTVEVEKETTTPVVEKKELYSEHKKFKSSPVISPVYGIEHPTSTNANDIELENTANYEKLDEEIRKTNEFLMTLKELQKKLD